MESVLNPGQTLSLQQVNEGQEEALATKAQQDKELLEKELREKEEAIRAKRVVSAKLANHYLALREARHKFDAVMSELLRNDEIRDAELRRDNDVAAAVALAQDQRAREAGLARIDSRDFYLTDEFKSWSSKFQDVSKITSNYIEANRERLEAIGSKRLSQHELGRKLDMPLPEIARGEDAVAKGFREELLTQIHGPTHEQLNEIQVLENEVRRAEVRELADKYIDMQLAWRDFEERENKVLKTSSPEFTRFIERASEVQAATDEYLKKYGADLAQTGDIQNEALAKTDPALPGRENGLFFPPTTYDHSSEVLRGFRHQVFAAVDERVYDLNVEAAQLKQSAAAKDIQVAGTAELEVLQAPQVQPDKARDANVRPSPNKAQSTAVRDPEMLGIPLDPVSLNPLTPRESGRTVPEPQVEQGMTAFAKRMAARSEQSARTAEAAGMTTPSERTVEKALQLESRLAQVQLERAQKLQLDEQRRVEKDRELVR